MKRHDLKVWPDMFRKLERGKNFELRRDDRGFSTGDILCLREYAPGPDEYTGRQFYAKIAYRLGSEDLPFGAAGLKPGYCILALSEVQRSDRFPSKTEEGR